jgi:hypothetical protein
MAVPNEIMRRMAGVRLAFAFLPVRGKAAAMTSGSHRAGRMYSFGHIAEVFIPRATPYQVVITTASGGLLRLFRSCYASRRACLESLG